MSPLYIRLAALITLPALLSSCATTGHNQRIVDARRTFDQGHRAGARTGAAIGALAAGYGFGRGRFNPVAALAGAAVGGLVGFGVGHLWANHVANQRDRYARAELYLDDCINQARETGERANRFNGALEQEITAVRRGDPSANGMLEDSRKVLANLNKEIELQRHAVAQAEFENASPDAIALLKGEISALEDQRSILRGHINRLVPKASPPRQL